MLEDPSSTDWRVDSSPHVSSLPILMTKGELRPPMSKMSSSTAVNFKRLPRPLPFFFLVILPFLKGQWIKISHIFIVNKKCIVYKCSLFPLLVHLVTKVLIVLGLINPTDLLYSSNYLNCFSLTSNVKVGESSPKRRAFASLILTKIATLTSSLTMLRSNSTPEGQGTSCCARSASATWG